MGAPPRRRRVRATADQRRRDVASAACHPRAPGLMGEVEKKVQIVT